MSVRLLAPYIRWGTNYQSAFYLGFPLDNVIAYSAESVGSLFKQYPGGDEDSWIPAFDQVLEGDIRYIPGSDTLFYPRCTGWDFNGANTPGVRQFSEWAKAKKQFDWHSDGRNLLCFPTLTSSTIDRTPSTSAYAGWTSAATGSTSGVTVSFDGVAGAWKVIGTSTGTTQYVNFLQRFPVIPGETLYFSADYQTSGLVSGAAGALYLNALDGSLSYINTPVGLQGLTAGSFTRAITALSSAFPSNSAYCEAHLRLELPNNGSSGTIWWRNAMVRRDSSSSTFIDNSYVQTAYLADPYNVPTFENDGQRRWHVKMRQRALDWSSY